MRDAIARLIASAERARERAQNERAREYDGCGERPADIAAYWERQAAASLALVEVMRKRTGEATPMRCGRRNNASQ